MPVIGGQNLTLTDITKRLDPDGSAAAIAELLSQENEILDDMPWVEGNLPTGHRVTARTGLPEVAWRKLNQGVPASKSTTAQIDEACGMLEGFGQVDKDLAELNGNTAAFRLQENMGYIEALNQTMASTLFYGDTAANPERFLGIAPRFSTVNIANAQNAQNVIDAAGTGTDNTSIYLVGWSPNTVHGIYPKGSQGGLIHEDLGLDTVTDAAGNRYRAYQDRYQWKCGVAVRDWRYIVRIANIDISDLTRNAATGADLIDLMTRALERIQSLSGVTPVFYANRTIRAFLRRQTVNRVANSTLQYDMVGGKPALRFAEVPIKRVDAILSNEARVV
jgi:hypothetical protein